MPTYPPRPRCSPVNREKFWIELFQNEEIYFRGAKQNNFHWNLKLFIYTMYIEGVSKILLKKHIYFFVYI